MLKGAVLLTIVPAIAVLLSGTLAGQAQAPTAGMSLAATAPASCNNDGCTVQSNSPFSITVRADPPPNADLGGLSTEVVFGGLVWQIRSCLNELQIERSDGQDVASCTQAPGPAGQARHVVVSEVAAPPLTPLEGLSAGDVIFELAVRCPQQGTYDVVLTAETESSGAPDTNAPFGALYFGADTAPIPVRTQGTVELDLDGAEGPDENDYAFADRLRIECQGMGGVGFQSPEPIETLDGQQPGIDTVTPGGPTATGGAAEGTPTAGGTLDPADATATAAAVSNQDDDDGDDGGNVWLWVIVGVAAAGAAGGLGYLAWRRYQRPGTPPEAGTPPS